MQKEIEDHVAYLNGLCKEEESLKLVDAKISLFEARKAWDHEYYLTEANYREEKFIDSKGGEWFLLLEHSFD